MDPPNADPRDREDLDLINRLLHVPLPKEPVPAALLKGLFGTLVTFSYWMLGKKSLSELQAAQIPVPRRLSLFELMFLLQRVWIMLPRGPVRQEFRAIVRLATDLAHVVASTNQWGPVTDWVPPPLAQNMAGTLGTLMAIQESALHVPLVTCFNNRFAHPTDELQPPVHGQPIDPRDTLIGFIAICFSSTGRNSLLWGNLAVQVAVMLHEARIAHQ
ncbi:hypothetical protein Q8F55_003309 [Vanrija albida]|uniref:Transcription factor domain-containing protein n=1 Tax=Vanrija albida TaxID=181172 RepID=A0ABR3Q4F6_9TREE